MTGSGEPRPRANAISGHGVDGMINGVGKPNSHTVSDFWMEADSDRGRATWLLAKLTEKGVM